MNTFDVGDKIKYAAKDLALCLYLDGDYSKDLNHIRRKIKELENSIDGYIKNTPKTTYDVRESWDELENGTWDSNVSGFVKNIKKGKLKTSLIMPQICAVNAFC